MRQLNPSASEYARRLFEAVEYRGMSNSSLAEQIGVSPTAIGKLFKGTSNSLSAENHVMAAKVLNISSEWLALNEGEMEPLSLPMRDLNGIEGQLITFFRGMRPADQDRLISAASSAFNSQGRPRPPSLVSVYREEKHAS